MSSTAIESYLSAALDQEACKATLLAALASRVAELRQSGIRDGAIIVALENLADDALQLNDNVIEIVITQMLSGDL